MLNNLTARIPNDKAIARILDMHIYCALTVLNRINYPGARQPQQQIVE